MVTGFEIHGSFGMLGFRQAVAVHNFCVVLGAALYVFILGWMIITTGWKHYASNVRKVPEAARLYLGGIFRGKAHPASEGERNVLQRRLYLGVALCLVPFQAITGFIYFTYSRWQQFDFAAGFSLKTVAVLHTVGAFAFLIFVIVHAYMITTGPTPTAHLVAMITGCEDASVDADMPEVG